MTEWWFEYKEVAGFQLSLHFLMLLRGCFQCVLIASAEQLLCLTTNDVCLLLYFQHRQFSKGKFSSKYFIYVFNNFILAALVSICFCQSFEHVLSDTKTYIDIAYIDIKSKYYLHYENYCELVKRFFIFAHDQRYLRYSVACRNWFLLLQFEVYPR